MTYSVLDHVNLLLELDGIFLGVVVVVDDLEEFLMRGQVLLAVVLRLGHVGVPHLVLVFVLQDLDPGQHTDRSNSLFI